MVNMEVQLNQQAKKKKTFLKAFVSNTQMGDLVDWKDHVFLSPSLCNFITSNSSSYYSRNCFVLGKNVSAELSFSRTLCIFKFPVFDLSQTKPIHTEFTVPYASVGECMGLGGCPLVRACPLNP